MGRLFYDMGLLSSADVHICSVTDLIGEYSGHTGPKVLAQFDSGLGKVLFIDEAYRLTSLEQGDHFTREAVGEIVDAMTKPRYMGNMVVILAGYGDEMEKLMQVNPGLRSRFPTHITFPSMKPDHCFEYLTQLLSKMSIKPQPDTPSSETQSGNRGRAILEVFRRLSLIEGWGNARDVGTLAESIIGHSFVKVSAAEAEEMRAGGVLRASFMELMEPCIAMLEARSKTKWENRDILEAFTRISRFPSERTERDIDAFTDAFGSRDKLFKEKFTSHPSIYEKLYLPA